MQTLQRILPTLLLFGAIGVMAATFFSDHKADYGEVALPAGGVVDLPEGTSSIYVGAIELPPGDEVTDLAGGLAFVLEPVGGGEQPALTAPGGSDDLVTQSSEAVANKDAVADVEVAREGAYRVSGHVGNLDGVEVSFGRSAVGAVLDGWRLWGGMLVAALLITLIPNRGHTATGEGWRREEDAPGPVGDPARPATAHSSGYRPYNG